MSAITGIFYRDGRNVDEKQIKKMNDRLSHRGPDGSAFWCEGSVALGHQMLYTTPESLHETLPFEEDGLVITADARIDNRKKLSVKLEIEDIEEVSDSYFILKAYQKWGEKCPEELLGDFAFAIWDKDKEELFCARDHMGVKPFYYYLSDELFVFGTEMKVLFSNYEVPRKLNELKIVYYLMFEYTDKVLTFYQDVLRLPAARLLKLDPKKVKIKKYWKLDPQLRIEMDSDEDYIKKFSEIFTEAVKCRLRSAFPIGFELSGGLDSSSVVCVTKEIVNEGNSNSTNLINTFSYSFKDIPESDERFYIKKVINTGGIRHFFVYGDDVSPMENMKSIIWHIEQPSYNPYFPIIWKLYKKMEEMDIRVSLSGTGGDGTISHGKYCIKDLAVELKLKRLIKELNSFSKLNNEIFIRSLINQVLFPFLPKLIKNALIRMKGTGNEKNIVNTDFLNRFGGKEYFNELLFGPGENSTKTSREYHFFELNDISLQSHSEDMDKVASAFHIEPRHPYFDKRLIEFCYGIPNEMKFRCGWGRYLQRIALREILPKEIQLRFSKVSFSPILDRNLLLFEKNYLKEILYFNNKSIEDFVDLDMGKEMYKDYISGEHGPRDVRDLWLIMILYFWLNIKKFDELV